MKKCLIIGKPNVGKTLFLINFAEYLGYRNIDITKKNYDGITNVESYSIKEATQTLSSKIPYMTSSLQTIQIDIPLLKGKKELEFIDSSGIIDGIHSNIYFRKAMAQTLSLITQSDILIHIIDISAMITHKGYVGTLGDVDLQLANYGHNKGGYLMLANKVDILERKTPLIELQKKFPDIYIIPISALTKQGFSEVKAYVARRI